MGWDVNATVLSFLTLGASDVVKVAEQAINGDHQGEPPAASSTLSGPPQPDYSDASKVMSDNGKTVAMAQINQMEFQLQQAAGDREMSNAANLELSLQKFDTGLQTSKLNYQQSMVQEQDAHLERLAQAHAQQVQLIQGGGQSYADIPPPMFD